MLMEHTIQEVIAKLFNIETTVQLTRPDPKFGDFATNVALQLAKPLGKNPREIAEAIAEELRGHEELSEVSVAGPGFINVTLSDQAVLESLKMRPATNRAGKKVVIETNCPNPFKAMHIGHALNAILADTMANLLAASVHMSARVCGRFCAKLTVMSANWTLSRLISATNL